MAVQTKICGVKTPDTLEAAVEAGARFVGFVFYSRSPRHVEIDVARQLALMLPTGVRGVGLFVDPTDEDLECVLGRVQLDMIQLHGNEFRAGLPALYRAVFSPRISRPAHFLPAQNAVRQKWCTFPSGTPGIARRRPWCNRHQRRFHGTKA